MSKESYRYYFKIKDWIPTNSSLSQAFKCIQSEEQDRIKRFRFKDNFKEALIGRLFLRKIVKQRFNLKNCEIKLTRNEHGRPILSNGDDESTDDQIFNQSVTSGVPTFDFNISHHGDYCVAVGENVRRIGVDVMKIEKRSAQSLDEYFRTMKSKFTDDEWRFINAIKSDNDRIRRFIRLWTLKESFVKADGRGLGIDLRRINFKCKTNDLRKDKITNDTILEFDEKFLNDWKFAEYLLSDDYCVAIAMNKPTNSDQPFLSELKFEQLISDLEPLDHQFNTNSLWEMYSEKYERN